MRNGIKLKDNKPNKLDKRNDPSFFDFLLSALSLQEAKREGKKEIVVWGSGV